MEATRGGPREILRFAQDDLGAGYFFPSTLALPDLGSADNGISPYGLICLRIPENSHGVWVTPLHVFCDEFTGWGH